MEKIKRKVSESQALARMAAYCSRAERCEFDVRKKLDAWELSVEEKERILSRLIKEKFVNERRFCESFVRDKVRFNKWGKVKIVFELRKKRISGDCISECVADINVEDLDESLTRILETKMKSVKAENDYERRTKLMRFAAGRGFSFDQISKVLTKLMGQSEDDFE